MLVSAKKLCDELGISYRRLNYLQSLGLIYNLKCFGRYRLYDREEVENIVKVDKNIKKYKKKMIEQNIETKIKLTKYEADFWDRFPELLFDDPEDQYYEIIEILRNTAISALNEMSDFWSYIHEN